MTKKVKGSVSDAQRRQYDAEGYLVLDVDGPEGLLDAIIEDLGDKYEDSTYPRVNNRLLDDGRSTTRFVTLARNPEVLAVLESLL